MVSQTTLRKIIHGVEVLYDSELDIISNGEPSMIRAPFNRTQVKQEFDLCAEITTKCNLSCQNCFSESFHGKQGIYLDYRDVHTLLNFWHAELIRFCVTGGEPLMHPEIESFLRLPKEFPDIGYVISTNGTLRPDLDVSLISNSWLVAISLHGRKETHNSYSCFDSFCAVRKRIENLASRTRVHIYCVIHDALTLEDVEWIYRFRNNSGASFLRFIIPRAFGRYKSLSTMSMVDEIVARLDDHSGLKYEASKTKFLETSGLIRKSF